MPQKEKEKKGKLQGQNYTKDMNYRNTKKYSNK